MAREFAAANVPTLRFDCRGMGDSGGTFPGFENISPDIRAAMNAFVSNTPGLREVVIWGLCDAASAALFYGYRDQRVSGMILLNPWIRTESVQARAYSKHYYPGRATCKLRH
jgi:alpha/beta superfamily hydrolase